MYRLLLSDDFLLTGWLFQTKRGKTALAQNEPIKIQAAGEKRGNTSVCNS